MRRFPRKGMGRIFVEKHEDIERVKQVIKEMDEFEFEYIPSGLITVFNPSETPSMSFTSKFYDLDIDELIIRCWKAGIKCFAVAEVYDSLID